MKEIFLNLNFDDFHPQNDNVGDFGGLGGAAISFFEELFREFPNLKITMFTTPNWVDRPMKFPSSWYHLRKLFGIRPVVPSYINEPFRIDKHNNWCAWVKQKISEGRLEIMVHGYKHHNKNITVHGQEFLNIKYETAKESIEKAEKLFDQCGIHYVKGFRPPGWGYSSGLFKALKELNYSIVSIFPSQFRISEVGDINGFLVPPQNVSVHESIEIALAEAEKSGLVFLKGHIAYQYGSEIIENGLSEKNKENLKQILRELELNYSVNYVNLYSFTLSHRK